jgi:hypothetical protein
VWGRGSCSVWPGHCLGNQRWTCSYVWSSIGSFTFYLCWALLSCGTVFYPTSYPRTCNAAIATPVPFNYVDPRAWWSYLQCG